MNKRPDIITVSLILLIGLSITGWPNNSSAQYFGRNKVQYEQFDFEVIETEHIDVYHYPPARQAAMDAARMAERWYNRYQRVFGHELAGRQPLILYANHPDFQQTNAIPGQISQGTGGITEGLKRRVVLPMTGIYVENDHVIGHELVHAFQYSIAASGEDGRGRRINAPLWFIEGMSEYLSVGNDYTLTAMWLRDAVLNDDVPSLEDMSTNVKYFPYRWGHAFWIYAAGHYGDAVVADLYRAVLNKEWRKGFESLLGISVDSLS